MHHQRITRPDQDREDFNLADLILELSFLFDIIGQTNVYSFPKDMHWPTSPVDVTVSVTGMNNWSLMMQLLVKRRK